MSSNKGLKNNANAPSPWSMPIEAAEVPEAGLHVELEADEAARAGIAKLAGLTALPKLQAAFDVARRGAGLHVTGRVTGEVGQTCVVTLEPLSNAVDEEVDLLFLPDAPEPLAEGDTDEDAPEPLIGGRIDLGAIATEFLMLGVDPYPRKEGVSFDPPQVDDDTPHPFAALAALKKEPPAHS
jgi:uncharacterized metal-binding protein YceD (DUF177 family)